MTKQKEIREGIDRVILCFFCSALERLCCLTHPFWRIEIWLTGRYCNLCLLSLWINDKYKLDIWKPAKPLVKE